MRGLANITIVLSLLWAATTGAAAQREPAAEPLTAENVEAWLDGFIPYAIKTADVAGAVVTVVKDGDTLVNKGYGLSDIERGTPIDPENTLFRPGSVSKLFIWTAIMQLVEQGKIDLDADVNTYIDFTIPSPRGTITVRQLMTHTPGFEEVLKDLFVEGKSFEEGDLRRFLVDHIPEQIFDPGVMPAYTNYASSLAGYIIERVSGKSFEAYVEDNIFAPLGMTQSSFRQPLPEPLAAQMSQGYKSLSEAESKEFEVVIAMPAGGLSATGADIAKFMKSILNGGADLMSAETVRQMHETLDNQFPPLNGFALGFYRSDLNGQRIVSHGGDTIWFHSDLNLFIDQNVGIYISMNSQGGDRAGPIRQNFLAAFADRYFPERQRPLRPRSSAEEHGKAMVGTYEVSRASGGNAFAVARFGGQIKVTMNEDNELIIPFARSYAGELEPLVEIEPWVWQSASGRKVAARVENGQVVAIATEPALLAFTPVPWQRSSAWLIPAMAISMAILIITFLAWPVRAYARKRFVIGFPYDGRNERAYRAAPIAALLVLVYLGGWAWFVAWMSADFFNLDGAKNEPRLLALYIAAVLPIGATLLAGWAAYVKVTSWHGWFTKISSILLVFACAVFVWFAAVNGMFSFDMSF